QDLVFLHSLALLDQDFQHLSGDPGLDGIGIHLDLCVVGVHINQAVDQKKLLQGQAGTPDCTQNQHDSRHEQLRTTHGTSHQSNQEHEKKPPHMYMLSIGIGRLQKDEKQGNTDNGTYVYTTPHRLCVLPLWFSTLYCSY